MVDNTFAVTAGRSTCKSTAAVSTNSPWQYRRRETSPGRAVSRNLRSAGFQGWISLVNTHYGEIEGIKAVKTIHELRETPDLLVIATPQQSVAGIVRPVKKATATAISITAGIGPSGVLTV